MTGITEVWTNGLTGVDDQREKHVSKIVIYRIVHITLVRELI